MKKIRSSCVACIIIFGLIYSLPFFCCAQNIQNTADQKPSIAAGPRITEQARNKDGAVDGQEKRGGSFALDPDDYSTEENNNGDEKRDTMEHALELLEGADKLWEKGDIEETLNALDEAYSLLLDADGDGAISQEKDNLRFLIARRILAVYSSKRTVLDGKNSEIPLTMNADIEKEIRSFQGIEREKFIAAYQRSGMYRSAIVNALKEAGIPEELFWLPLVESFFKINAYSRARALGLWQFIPSTGYKFGLSRDEWIDERMDVQKSTRAAIAYLKELHSMFGDWLTALAAYNCGEGRVLRVISRQHINYLDSFWDLYRQLPNETARYVPRFLATLHIVKDPQKYGFALSAADNLVSFETVKVNKVMKLQDIAEKIEVSEEVLNLLNSELRHKLTPDRGYNLKVPEGYAEKFRLIADSIPQGGKPRFASASSEFIKHKVKKGETVASIARKYHVSSSKIMSNNKIKNKNKLVQGQVLKIPTTSRGSYAALNVKKTRTASSGKYSRYKVKRGDTLSSIAGRFETTPAKIRQLNNLKTDKVYVGQVLKIQKGR